MAIELVDKLHIKSINQEKLRSEILELREMYLKVLSTLFERDLDAYREEGLEKYPMDKAMEDNEEYITYAEQITGEKWTPF